MCVLPSAADEHVRLDGLTDRISKNDMASFLAWCISANTKLHYKALVDTLATNTFSKVRFTTTGYQIANLNTPQVDPNTGSQFLLDCVCLLLRVGHPDSAGDATVVDTTAHNELASDEAADPSLPPTVWHQRYLLCHMMLDLIQQPFTVRMGTTCMALCNIPHAHSKLIPLIGAHCRNKPMHASQHCFLRSSMHASQSRYACTAPFLCHVLCW